MQLYDAGKLGLIALVLVGTFTLIGLGEITWEQGSVVIVGAATYLMGNGTVAVRGKAPSPVIVPRVEGPEVATTHGTTIAVADIVHHDVKSQDETEPQHRRQPGHHVTGEHFLRPPTPHPRPEELPPMSWQRPPPPGYENPLTPGEPPYDVIRRAAAVAPAAGFRDPPTGFDQYMVQRQVEETRALREQADAQAQAEAPADLASLCVCGHPALHHAQSPTGEFLYCVNVTRSYSGAEARCACDEFRFDQDHPNNRRPEEEHYGPTT